GVVDDLPHHVERRILAPEVERSHEGDERAHLALGQVLMGELGALGVVRASLEERGGLQHLVRRDVQELRIRVDVPLDQPGACHAIDVAPCASDPEHGDLLVRVSIYVTSAAWNRAVTCSSVMLSWLMRVSQLIEGK